MELIVQKQNNDTDLIQKEEQQNLTFKSHLMSSL